MAEPVEFVATLSESDWEPHLGGWRCSALAIPGAEVSIIVDGVTQSPDRFAINPHLRIIRWLGSPSDRPTSAANRSIVAVIKLTKRLTPLSVPIIVAVIGALATLAAALITSGILSQRG